MCIYIHVCVCVYLNIHTYFFIYICMYIFICVDIHVYMVIYIQDSFAKMFGENVTIGAEFFKAVVKAQFDPLKLFPMIRAGLVATNLASQNTNDGVATMLAKADVDKLKGKLVKPQLERAEALLFKGWEQINKIIDAEVIAVGDGNATCGRLMYRTIVFLCKKQKQSFEDVRFESLEQV